MIIIEKRIRFNCTLVNTTTHGREARVLEFINDELIVSYLISLLGIAYTI